MNFVIPDDKLPLFPRPLPDTKIFERENDPPLGPRVFVIARDKWGEYRIPFPIYFTDQNVFNAQMRVPLADDVSIVAWRLS